MANIVRDMPTLFLTSSASPRTNLIGKLDDASSITIMITSSSGVLSSACAVITAPWDVNDPLPSNATTSMFSLDVVVGTSLFLTSGTQAVTIANISFRSIGLQTSANALTTAQPIAYVTKQISV